MSIIMWQSTDGTQTYFIHVDATLQETHSFVNTVTDHPVERGSALTDHVRPDPVRVSLSGMISNHPHYLPQDNIGGVEEDSQTVDVNIPGRTRVFPITSPTDGLRTITDGTPPSPAVLVFSQRGYAASAKVLTFTLSFDRVRAVFDALTQLRDNGTLVQVDTSLRRYDDMVIESLNVPRSADVGESLVFDVGFKQVRTVELSVVKVKRNKGQVTKKVVTPVEEQAADNTVLGWLTDKVTGQNQ